MSGNAPLISEESAVYLAKIVNRAAASLDVAKLSAEEVVEVYTLADRLIQTLWLEHANVVLPLYMSLLERLGLASDDEPEGGGGVH